MARSRKWVLLADIHSPRFHRPTWQAVLAFLRRNKVDGIVMLGDQFDNACISHHNEGKALLKPKGQFARDTREFEREILTPLERLLPTRCEKVWIVGNHDDWESQLVERNQELKGAVERPILLRLAERGWRIVPLGRSHRHGKLSMIHGESLTTQHHAKRAVEVFCGNVVYGHFHTLQTFTRVLARDPSQKWTATCLPILGACNATYLKGKATNWVNGFGIVEFFEGGLFNLYPIVVTRGRFAYGGRVYGGGRT